MTSGRFEYESGYVRWFAHPPESAHDGNIETGSAGHNRDKFCRKKVIKKTNKSISGLHFVFELLEMMNFVEIHVLPRSKMTYLSN